MDAANRINRTNKAKANRLQHLFVGALLFLRRLCHGRSQTLFRPVNTVPQTLAVIVLLLSVALGPTATLNDFGYQNTRVNGKLATGTRPLLVVMACFDTNGFSTCFGNYPQSKAFYQNRLFGPNNSVNGYFRENSNGRFSWLPVDTSEGAGTGVVELWLNTFGNCLGDIGIPNPYQCYLNRFGSAGQVLYYSNIVFHALQSVPLQHYDANGDGTVTQDELTIAIINSDLKRPVTRSAGRVPAADVQYQGEVANLGFFDDFDSWCHELAHTLGAPWDLYLPDNGSCLNNRVSLMSCTVSDANDTSAYHLDPWHKMQLGWCEPRLRSLTAGGIETIPATQLMDPSAPVLLFDPSRSNDEFFMLEYRSRNPAAGAGYDRDVASSGLAIWHVQQDANHNPKIVDNSWTVWNEGSPDLARGSSVLWRSDVTTPPLAFLNGGSTGTRVRTFLFDSNANSIRVEWLYPGETWVDFTYVGLERGVFDLPYNTLTEGVFYASHGGVIHLRTGSRTETLSISKRLTLRAYNGAVTIGR